MTTDPDQIRAEIAALLSDLPDIGDERLREERTAGAEGADLASLDIDALAARLEEAHDVLVRALESVDPTSIPAPSA